jgi:hypothetical protein
MLGRGRIFLVMRSGNYVIAFYTSHKIQLRGTANGREALWDRIATYYNHNRPIMLGPPIGFVGGPNMLGWGTNNCCQGFPINVAGASNMCY